MEVPRKMIFKWGNHGKIHWVGTGIIWTGFWRMRRFKHENMCICMDFTNQFHYYKPKYSTVPSLKIINAKNLFPVCQSLTSWWTCYSCCYVVESLIPLLLFPKMKENIIWVHEKFSDLFISKLILNGI